MSLPQGCATTYDDGRVLRQVETTALLMSMRLAGCTAAGRSSGTLFVDHGAAPENAELNADSASDDFANRLAGFRVFRQRRVIHALMNFEASRRIARLARNGLVGVGWHG